MSGEIPEEQDQEKPDQPSIDVKPDPTQKGKEQEIEVEEETKEELEKQRVFLEKQKAELKRLAALKKTGKGKGKGKKVVPNASGKLIKFLKQRSEKRMKRLLGKKKKVKKKKTLIKKKKTIKSNLVLFDVIYPRSKFKNESMVRVFLKKKKTKFLRIETRKNTYKVSVRKDYHNFKRFITKKFEDVSFIYGIKKPIKKIPKRKLPKKKRKEIKKKIAKRKLKGKELTAIIFFKTNFPTIEKLKAHIKTLDIKYDKIQDLKDRFLVRISSKKYKRFSKKFIDGKVFIYGFN